MTATGFALGISIGGDPANQAAKPNGYDPKPNRRQLLGYHLKAVPGHARTRRSAPQNVSAAPSPPCTPARRDPARPPTASPLHSHSPSASFLRESASP